MQLSTDDLDLIAHWYTMYTTAIESDDADKELHGRIIAEIKERNELESFVSDCGDSCKL